MTSVAFAKNYEFSDKEGKVSTLIISDQVVDCDWENEKFNYLELDYFGFHEAIVFCPVKNSSLQYFGNSENSSNFFVRIILGNEFALRQNTRMLWRTLGFPLEKYENADSNGDCKTRDGLITVITQGSDRTYCLKEVL